MSVAALEQHDDLEEEGVEGSESSESEEIEQYKELEHIYNKLVVTNRGPNFGPPVRRTHIPGAHARKLGIRLKTAKELSEKTQLPKRLKTADPRLSRRGNSATSSMEDAVITPLPTENTPRLRAETAFATKPPMSGVSTAAYRKGAKSAPPSRVKYSRFAQADDIASEPYRVCRSTIPAYSSLAMYSPQTQRFTIEQLAMEQTKTLKRLSHIQTHRVDKGFYVSGATCDLQERYNIDEQQYTLLMEITNRGKQTNKKVTGLRLSNSILKHFTPQPYAEHERQNPQRSNLKTSTKGVSLNLNNSIKSISKPQQEVHHSPESSQLETHATLSPTEHKEAIPNHEPLPDRPKGANNDLNDNQRFDIEKDVQAAVEVSASPVQDPTDNIDSPTADPIDTVRGDQVEPTDNVAGGDDVQPPLNDEQELAFTPPEKQEMVTLPDEQEMVAISPDEQEIVAASPDEQEAVVTPPDKREVVAATANVP